MPCGRRVWASMASARDSSPSRLGTLMLLLLSVVLCCALAAEGAVKDTPSSPASDWVERTSHFFSSKDPLPPLRVNSITDWYNNMNTNFLGTMGAARKRVVMWGSDGFNQQQQRIRESNRFSLKWESKELPGDGDDGTPPYVVSATAADFLGNGNLDVIVQGSEGGIYFIQHGDTTYTPRRVTVRNRGGETSGGAAVNLRMKYPSAPQLALAVLGSANGEPELLYVNEVGQLLILQRAEADAGTSITYNATALVHEGILKDSREVLPFSLALADVNGDCAAELLYVVRDVSRSVVEVYMYVVATRQHILLLTLQESDEVYYGEPTVADVDGDGAPDLAFPVCNRPKNPRGPSALCDHSDRVSIFFNLLRTPPQGCSTGAATSSCTYFDASISHLFGLPQMDCGLAGVKGNMGPLTMPGGVEAPLLLRAGDFNNDRLTDFVVPSSYGPLILEASADGKERVRFTCTPLDLSKAQAADSAGLRYRSAVPFFGHVEVPGRTDVLLTHLGSNASTIPDSSAVLAIYVNDKIPDRNYFLLVSAIRGEAKSTYGVPQVGAVHHFAWQDTQMHTHSSLVTQFSRTQANALQCPRIQVGLGETFSYIQGYTTGANAPAAGAVLRRWTSYLVPNSQVFTAMHPYLEPKSWSLQLYLPTSQYKTLLVVVLSIALVIVGVAVVILRCQEMKQDYTEWKLR